MMTELSLNILDVAQNSVRAKASLIEITVEADTDKDLLEVNINDDGCGMSKEVLRKVEDPFYTSRTTRKAGLGVSFFKLAAESAGGTFEIDSEEGQGTRVRATFVLSHIDRIPLGDIGATIHALVTLNENIHFLFRYRVDEREFTLDTRELREVLGDVPFRVPEVSNYIREYLKENKKETDGDVIL